jgi:tRNA threonylcarbamoyladenosine biosynthesis protein TsaB
MIVLALDTTSQAGSAALLRDSVVLQEVTGDLAVTQVQRLPMQLARLLEEVGVALAEVDLLAVSVGPGSFTGLRVGIAAMQGLAVAADKLIVPVPALEALAHAGAGRGLAIAPWIDAQRGQVFAALYDAAGGQPLREASALPPRQTLELLALTPHSDRVRFVGDGAVRYAAEIATIMGARGEVDDAVPLLAGHVARIGAEGRHRPVPPHLVAPIYVRRPDVELARDLRAQGK